MSKFQDPWHGCGYVPYVTGDLLRGGATPGAGLAPAWSPPFRPYRYRGTGSDELTAFMDEQLAAAPVPSPRQERMAGLAGMRLWDGPEAVPPPGYVTAAQAAATLGISPRTVFRYKAALAGRPS